MARGRGYSKRAVGRSSFTVTRPSLHTHWRLQGDGPAPPSIWKGPCGAPSACTSHPISLPRDSITTFPRRGLAGRGEARPCLHERWSGLHSIVPATLMISRDWLTIGIRWERAASPSAVPSNYRKSPAVPACPSWGFLQLRGKNIIPLSALPLLPFLSLPCRQTQHEVPEELVAGDASPAGSQMPTASPAHVMCLTFLHLSGLMLFDTDF